MVAYAHLSLLPRAPHPVAHPVAQKTQQLVRMEAGETLRLASSACSIVERAERLVAMMDQDHQAARAAGMETLAIELSGILEGRRLASVVDALDDALSRQEGVDLTDDGLALLRRTERLVSEAERRVPTASNSLSGTKRLGQAESGFPDTATIAVIALGLMGLGALGALVYFFTTKRA